MVLVVLASLFALAALGALHVAGGMALAEYVTTIHAVLIVAGIDAVVAFVLLAVAARDVPGAVEREALRLRRDAIDQALEAVVLTTVLSSLRRVRSLRELYGVVAAALAGWVVGGRR